MRAAMMLVLLACIPAPAVRAVPCSGAEQLMLSIGKELSAGSVSGAEQILREMDSTHPECAVTILAHARVAEASGAAVEAEDYFLRYAEVVPNEARAYSHHARFLLARGQLPRADALAAVALGKDPNDVGALTVDGAILDMKGQAPEGKKVLEEGF